MNQTEQILNYLRTGQSLTPLECLNRFQCFRLGARIWDIKKMGYKVETELVRQGNKKFASYKLSKERLF